MKKKCRDFNVAYPESVNSDHQEVPVNHADPFGSYTGIPFEGYEKPVQDADDL